MHTDEPMDVLRERILRVLPTLSAREQEVLRLRFGLAGDPPQTLEAVGRVFGVTRERIRQIEAKALRKVWEGGPVGPESA